MKLRLKSLLRPTNRGIRILVGLLLAAFLAVQVAQSIATNKVEGGVVLIDGQEVEVSDPQRHQELRRLAETDHIALLERALEEFDARGPIGYTCTFIKQERIGSTVGKEQHIHVKFMPRPFSVAMHWTKNSPTGDALLYVDGKYKDESGRSQMVVRPANGLLRGITGGSVLRLPDGPDAMKATLRPCTEFGLRNSLQSLLDVYRRAKENGELNMSFGGFSKVGDRYCFVLERTLPDNPDYPAKLTKICLDVDTLLPLQVYGTNWQDEFLCNYEYHNMNFDAGLTAEDFTPAANDIKMKN
jgi:hypothetical protein